MNMKFDQLSTEIIFEIFDYFSSDEIISTFFDLNQRFTSITLEYQRCLRYFQTPTTNIDFWKNLFSTIGSNIQCLIVTTFDSIFPVDLFPNLKSIIISTKLPIDSNQFYSIIENSQFNQLETFKIQTEIFGKQSLKMNNLFEKVFNNENSLKTFEYFSSLFLYNSKLINNLKITENLCSLKIKTRYCLDGFYLLAYTPNLKSFNLIFVSTAFNDQMNKINFSNINLKSLYLTFDVKNKTEKFTRKDFLLLTNLIKQFSSSLICLSLNLNSIDNDQFQFDGYVLQQQLLESLINLNKFYLYVKLDEQPNDIEHLLLTFKAQFWYDHHWTIGSHGQYLYTLPFHFQKFEGFIDFDQIKSTNTNILNDRSTWYRIKSLVWHTSNQLNLNLLEQIKQKMPNLSSIMFTSSSFEDFQVLDETNLNNYPMDSQLESVTTIDCQCECLEDIKRWFIHILPNVKHCFLYYSPESVSRLYDRIIFSNKSNEQSLSKWLRTNSIYFSKIENLEMKVLLNDAEDLNKDGSFSIVELLNSLPNVKSFIFHFYWNRSFSHLPILNLTDFIQYLNEENILTIYQMKHMYNYLQLTKKQQ